MIKPALWTSLLAVTASATAIGSRSSTNTTNCRCFPGDACWPSLSEWDQFNQTIDGRLIKTIPLGKPCHAPNYDASVCAVLKEEWTEPELHYTSSSSIMAPWFANGSCDPFHPVAKPCTMGNYIDYAVNVSTPAHISAALRFADDHNIRLVIRNTGHDYNGKSTGAGALGVWTHNLKSRTLISNYTDKHYTGPAVRLGAGVQGFEAYEFADNHGYQVVGGECSSVGIAGGYTQGGGHSALSSRYGLAADQVLAWEVVTGTGDFVTATRDNEYKDLYWALSGGGGGTYGVVVAMTSKLHDSTPTSGLNLTFTNSGISQDTFFEAVTLYHTLLPSIVDAGVMSIWYFTNTTFYISPLTGPGIPLSTLRSLVAPFEAGLTKLGIQYTLVAKEFDTYLEQFNTMESEIAVGKAQYGGWLIPRDVVTQNTSALTEAYRKIVSDGATFIGVGLNVNHSVSGDVDNAVLPAWRDALIDTTLTTPWEWDARDEMIVEQNKMTDIYIPLLEALSPNSGAYMNEGNFQQPEWKKAFYGSNYDRLLAVKNKYDPNGLFYALKAVGSDAWTQLEDGRLCRA
ncbi:FAD-dependent oxidoreductase [Aspergillus ibericus CBS 121593]|uniref:FAD/FMN-containing isoamyl alcohol oxidase MreA n=1 Tax=Aspergillus ibericus CBS 121593 TaxID=1448316 RepID=A0A395H1Q1_9EURO|nr:FAD/FMN-containing isoamyl alcohol oxidase MreA [Aspergillus ibericus CBS 121593]RAL00768.1 FAD/FMN-containing isoamyl alcohol oxidase MreA [Aspergillus ibericus CBS 121593]